MLIVKLRKCYDRAMTENVLSRELQSKHRSSGPCQSARPLRVETGAIIKRFLRSDAGRRQSCVEIRAANRFLLGHALAKKHGEAADESVASASAVDALDGEWWNVFAAVTTGEKRSIRAQCDDHASNAAGHEFLGTLLCVFDVLHRRSR